MKTSLTGIKPTATPHLGNYLGAIRPALRLSESYRTLYFIADYHALTTLRDPPALQQYVYDVAASWMASGLDPNRTLLYRQSAVPEVFELTWILCCLTATGQLERGHAYKDALAKGDSANAGIFNYPMLMAADVLLYDTDVVPVGKDQKQHMELTRDIANRFNHVFGEGNLVVPEALIGDAPLVPGTDGQKMSKSAGNAIPLFASAKELKKTVMQIKTSSEPVEAPKDPGSSVVFQLYSQVAEPAQVEEMAAALRKGGFGWGHAKQALAEALEAELGPRRERFYELRQDPLLLNEVLESGAKRARTIAHKTMRRVREAVGIDNVPERFEKKTVKLKR